MSSLSAAARLNELIIRAFDREDGAAIIRLFNNVPLDADAPEFRLIYIMVATAATVRSCIVELGTSKEQIAEQAERVLTIVQSIRTVIAESLEEHIPTMFTQALDAVETEVRVLSREMAHSEYRAAAALTAQAINDHVAALTAAANNLAAKQLIAGGPKVGEGSQSETPVTRPWYEQTWVVALVSAVFGAVAYGFLNGGFMSHHLVH